MSINHGFSFGGEKNIRKATGEHFESFEERLFRLLVGVDAVHILGAINGTEEPLMSKL